MKFLIPTSALLAVAKFWTELQEVVNQVTAIAQLPGMNIVFSSIILAFAVSSVHLLGALRTR